MAEIIHAKCNRCGQDTTFENDKCNNCGFVQKVSASDDNGATANDNDAIKPKDVMLGSLFGYQLIFRVPAELQDVEARSLFSRWLKGDEEAKGELLPVEEEKPAA